MGLTQPSEALIFSTADLRVTASTRIVLVMTLHTRGALQINAIAAEPRALALEHVDHAAEVRIHRPWDGVARSLPFAD
jgi:hypothetical protein